MKIISKKAMMDDLFDVLFTVMVAFFALLFINAALVKSIDDRNERSLGEMTAVLQNGHKIIVEQEALEQGGDASALLGVRAEIEKHSTTLPLKAARKEGEVTLLVEGQQK
ncbi:hypothetical protein J4210_02410 [Candidatus Woesearchaeota archaeon]|nr:hypothetical protein [Candidatus Woesearchaeota archaeon]